MKQNGFTVVELLVAMAIVGILIVIVLTAIFGGGFKETSCESYGWMPQKDIPAKCIEYFQGGEGK